MDSSVAIATVLVETRRPADTFWDETVVASRLTDLEMRVRVAHRASQPSVDRAVDWVSSRLDFVEMAGDALTLLYRDAPRGVRALDAIHLAALDYLNREVGETVLATYDRRLATAAASMGFTVITP